MQFCNHDISKSITAKSFKLDQLIEMMSGLLGENIKKLFFFMNYLPLQIWTFKICKHDISKSVTARSFKRGQLLEDDE